MKRIAIPELLDTDNGTPAEVASSLVDLNRINRWFGGVSTTSSLILEIAEKINANSLSLLEVASGAGYVPQATSRTVSRRGVQLNITLLDYNASHLRDRNGSGAVSGDAVSLPFRDESFDIVSSCLFLHHLPPEAVVASVKEGLRVCRTAVVINDVIRHPIHLALVYASLPLYRSRLTHHDAPASVRQAYTLEEMREMLRKTNASKVDARKQFLFRMGIIVWK